MSDWGSNVSNDIDPKVHELKIVDEPMNLSNVKIVSEYIFSGLLKS